MRTRIRQMGNSRGVLIPKPLLKQVGLEEEAELVVEGNTLVLRQPKRAPRAGWAEASRQLAQRGEDALVLPEFSNEGDADLKW
ncbi:MAG: AbrB/MazE/SpoVT family DNA-binding domain-containing protein [Acidobacteriota bacterium]